MTLKSSILIPSLGRPDMLGKCLHALNNQTTRPDQVIVVWQADDLKTRDAAIAAQAHLQFDLQVLHNPTRGVVPAENAALGVAIGDVILLIDDDAVPPPDWVSRHLAHYADPTIGAVGGPAVNHHPDGNAFRTRPNEPIGRLLYWGQSIGNMFDHPPQWRTRPAIDVDHLVGYNLSLRRSAFDRFDDHLRPYWQMFELDACLQVKERGFRVRFDFANGVDHFPTNNTYQSGRAGDLAVKIYNAAYNHSYILAKHSTSPWQAMARLIYLNLIGTVNAPGIAGSIVALGRYGNPRREWSVFWQTKRSRGDGWRAGRANRVDKHPPLPERPD